MIVSVDGAELFCVARGEGPVCFVLSAIGTEPYERMMPAALSDRLRLVFVDPRGAGRSTGEAADLTFDRLAEDLEAIRRDLGVARVAVFGHSIVGALAIEYARRRPQSVSHVVAVGTPSTGDVAAVDARAREFFAADASGERKSILEANLARLPPGATPGEGMYARTPMRFFDPRFDAPPLFEGAVARPEFLRHVMGTLVAGWNVESDPPLRVPLLLAHGRFDYVVPHSVWREVVGRMPGATLQLFERSGHQPFVEEPERFTAVVTEWMARH